MRLVSITVVLVAVLSTALQAQVIDADINPGDSFDGMIASTTDVDVLRFEAVAGSELTVKVGAKKVKGSASVLPRIQVLDLTSSATLVDEAPGSPKAAVSKLLLPNTGSYLIRISGSAASTGPYRVKTKAKLGKAARLVQATAETLAGGTLEASFDAGPGYLVSGVVKRDKGSTAEPAAPTLTGPAGAVDLTGFVATNTKKLSHKLKKAPLGALGTYTVAVDNGGVDAGSISIKFKLKPPKLQKTKRVELVGDSGVSAAKSLSGTVLDGGTGAALPGVMVLVIGGGSAVTDAAGAFIVHEPPMGDIEIEFDGTTATGPGSYPVLHVLAAVNSTGDTVLMPIVLPDLDDADSANDTVGVDGSGATTEPIAATGADPDIQLAGPTGTVILLNGIPAVTTVDLNVTPVDPANVPMPLVPAGGAVDASSYVTIQPAAATFDNGDTGMATGLDVVLPNDRNFPLGAMVDIWSFDHDAGDWVNRSTQTGSQGVVVSDGGGGTVITAAGVIVAGGWHAPVMPIDADCATSITGRVVDDFGQPIPSASISTSTGQFGTSGPDGSFSIPSVPAYDALMLPTCTDPLDAIDVLVISPVAYGAVKVALAVQPGSVVHGGATDVGDVMVSIPSAGSLAGILNDGGSGIPGDVELTGPTNATLSANAAGTFFTTGLAEGSYTASFTFAGDADATEVGFDITANQVTTIAIQRLRGGGAGSVTVLVLLDASEEDNSDMVPLQGAQVMLVGTDGNSSGGLPGTTDANGEAVFQNVDGPFTVTAQADFVLEGETIRLATTVVGVTPASGTIGLAIFLDDDDDGQPTPDATVQGTVSNLPALGPFESIQILTNDGGFAGVNPMTGAYTMGVPSGETFAVTLVRMDGSEVVSSMFELGVGPVAPAGALMLDFDMGGSGLIPYDREVDLSYLDTLMAADRTLLELTLFLPTGGDINLALLSFDAGTMKPASVMLPAEDDPNLAAFRNSLLFSQELFANDEGISCDVFLEGNPIAVQFDMPDLPEITNPAAEALLTLQQAMDLTIAYTPGSNGGEVGFDSIFIGSSEKTGSGLGVDFMAWEVLLPSGTTSVQLPPTVLPMFATGIDYELCVEEQRIEGLQFDYDSFFDEDFEANINAIDATADGFCETFTLLFFSTQ
jgi:hypothetical protein